MDEIEALREMVAAAEAAHAARAAAEALAPVLRTLAADDPGHRRRLHALRADPGYAAAWEEPDPLVSKQVTPFTQAKGSGGCCG
jgi:hypothetical protein